MLKQEVKITMEVSLKESNLLKKIRQIEESGEILLIVKAGRLEKIKYTTAYSFHGGYKLMNFEKLAELIKEKAPFGEVTILTRAGWPYGIKETLNFDDLSDGL